MELARQQTGSDAKRRQGERVLPEIQSPWIEFMRFCADLRHGEISRLKIQDGLPVLAEVTTQKVKFGK